MSIQLDDVPWGTRDTDPPGSGYGMTHNRAGDPYQDPRDPPGRSRLAAGRCATEDLDESECLRLLGAAQVGRLAYTGRRGLMVVPSVYKLHEDSIIFHPLEGTLTEEDLRTGIEHADYQVAFEIDQIDPQARGGWAVLVVGAAHHVDTEAERTSIVKAGADPWPWAVAEAVHLIRVLPRHIYGRRSYPV